MNGNKVTRNDFICNADDDRSSKLLITSAVGLTVEPVLLLLPQGRDMMDGDDDRAISANNRKKDDDGPNRNRKTHYLLTDRFLTRRWKKVEDDDHHNDDNKNWNSSSFNMMNLMNPLRPRIKCPEISKRFHQSSSTNSSSSSSSSKMMTQLLRIAIAIISLITGMSVVPYVHSSSCATTESYHGGTYCYGHTRLRRGRHSKMIPEVTVSSPFSNRKIPFKTPKSNHFIPHFLLQIRGGETSSDSTNLENNKTSTTSATTSATTNDASSSDHFIDNDTPLEATSFETKQSNSIITQEIDDMHDNQELQQDTQQEQKNMNNIQHSDEFQDFKNKQEDMNNITVNSKHKNTTIDKTTTIIKQDTDYNHAATFDLHLSKQQAKSFREEAKIHHDSGDFDSAASAFALAATKLQAAVNFLLIKQDEEEYHHSQQKQQQQQQQHSYKHTSSWNTYETSKRQEHNHDFALDENDMPPPSTNANPFRSARECITKPNHHTGHENGAPEDSNLQYNNSSQLQNHHGMGQSSIPTQSTQQHLLSTHHESNNPYFQGNNQYQNFINTTSQTTLQSQQHQSRNINNNNRANISAGLKRKFQPPKPRNGNSQGRGNNKQESNGGGGIQSAYSSNNPSKKFNDDKNDDDLPEELAHLDKQLVEKIMSEIIDNGDKITFDDIAGLADAKQTVMELVCWPMKRPDLFTGLRRGPNGLLLFGPPGTGKTLIGKAIAHESGATFFSISSSSLTSKWIGEGEKLVRTLFAVAAYKEPAVVFIDEIDSMLTQRKADENEASRRIKTEFLVQLDGTSTSGQGRVLVIGATNRPHELDDAARRRFVKRLYIPLPERADREVLLQTLLAKNSHSLTEKDIIKLSSETDGYSGADLKALCTDAALGPIRQLGRRALEVNAGEVPPISYRHFKHALRGMNPSVSQDDLFIYLEWNKTYGSKSVTADDYNGISDEDSDE